MGQLWSSGVKIDWHAIRGAQKRYRISLPTYPFDRKRFWIDASHHFLSASSGDSAEGVSRRLPELALERSGGESISSHALEKIIFEQLQLMSWQLQRIGQSRKKYDSK
jgi:acyl transferase domain-containing protein